MEGDQNQEQFIALKQRIVLLERQLDEAKSSVKQWIDTNAQLSRRAAEARAKNQGSGRGFLGALLGRKFRAATRTAAAASNAAIAKDVAEKRTKIANGKQEAQAIVKQLQDELKLAKQQLKELVTDLRTNGRAQSTSSKKSAQALDLLKKLKEAFDAGILTSEEYEQKRKQLLEDI